MSLFNVEVAGLDSLDKDLEKHRNAIKKQIPTALGIVGAEMVKDLQAIIEGYFYKKYTPSDYKRTGQMKDDSSMNYFPKGDSLIFTYAPETKRDGLDEWVQDKPIKGTFPLPRNPDDLIIWGQYSHFEGTDHPIPARPFWNYFLEEQGNEKILDNFARGMLPKYQVIKEEGEVVDLSDSELPADTTNVAPYHSHETSNDDLPF